MFLVTKIKVFQIDQLILSFQLHVYREMLAVFSSQFVNLPKRCHYMAQMSILFRSLMIGIKKISGNGRRLIQSCVKLTRVHLDTDHRLT
jgi:hypothetical protein